MGLLCVAIIAVGIATPRRAIDSQLYRHADEVLQELSSRGAGIDHAAAGTWSQQMSDAAAAVRNVLGYAVFDNLGKRLAVSADRADGPPLPGVVSRAASGPRVVLTRIENDRHLTDVATVRAPVSVGGKTVGSVVVTFDQTVRAQLLRDGLSWTSGMMLALLALGVGASLLFAWTRTRESQHAAARVRYFAEHDQLTGLPNRASFVQHLNQALARRKPLTGMTPIVRLNVDRFRRVNDIGGPGTGDTLLKILVDRLKGQIREGDLIARLAGDEFAIALFGVLDPHRVAGFVERLNDVLRQPCRISGESIACTMSSGVAIAPVNGEDADTLLKNADLALMRAKQEGGDRICFFEPGMNEALQRRHLLEQDLKQALLREEFEIAYQPQIELASGRNVGYEALIRWRHPVHGRIAPGHFIAVAEETGLIVQIGEWVLRRACLDAMSWPETVMVAVNLSPAQFKQGSVSEMVERVLRETGLSPKRLELEITENLLIDDTEAAIAELTRLRALGVAVAMDDFGTGYSSLSYLARFPFSKIKIDRGFTTGLMRDATVSAIVSTIVALGRALGIIVTAEGVEHEDQAALLKQLGCAQAQGYLFGRPAPLAELAPMAAVLPATSRAA